MAALLVALSVMAIMLGAALPSWRTYAQREREAEFFFRGEQWARGIRKFNEMYGGFPPDLDVLVRERFVRKKYKDPLTGGDFQPVSATATTGPPQNNPPGGQQKPPAPAGGGVVGIIGVTSKSNLKLFRIYNGRDIANQIVIMETQVGRAGGGARGGRAGERGGGADGRGGAEGRGIQQLPGGGPGPGGGRIGPGVQPPPGGRGTQPQQPPPGRGFGGRNFEN